jgi:hypothetical protein
LALLQPLYQSPADATRQRRQQGRARRAGLVGGPARQPWQRERAGPDIADHRAVGRRGPEDAGVRATSRTRSGCCQASISVAPSAVYTTRSCSASAGEQPPGAPGAPRAIAVTTAGHATPSAPTIPSRPPTNSAAGAPAVLPPPGRGGGDKPPSSPTARNSRFSGGRCAASPSPR